MPRLLSLALAALLFLPSIPASAQRQTYILRGNGEKAITVWRGESSAEAGTRLVNAGQSDLALRYVACAVLPGTRVVILPGGYETHRVMIVDGKFRGCEGNVYSWDINGDKKERQRKWKEYLDKSERESKKALEDARKRVHDHRSTMRPELKKYLDCSEKRQDPSLGCTLILRGEKP